MFISQKCQYAIRAIFELSLHNGQGLIKIAEIAKSQAIPVRFLEVILSQLKHGGFVTSQRGSEGGYSLAMPPDKITVGDIIRFIEGPIEPVGCMVSNPQDTCPLYGDCVFISMWERISTAMAEIFDSTDFQSLVHKEKIRNKSTPYIPCYSI